MIFPNYIEENDTIGICAPSAGVGRKVEAFELSLSNLHKAGFNTYETENVRLNDMRGGSAKSRASELTELLNNEEINMIMCATGGDFLMEMLEHFDFNEVVKQPKWIMGASDPTGLLYPITTKYDIATIYGLNAGAFDQEILHPSLTNALSIIKGEAVIQKSFDKYEPVSAKGGIGEYQLCEDVKWVNVHQSKSVRGRLIGGCFDVIKDLLGTPYDGTKDFIERYKEDGIVWYFDIFAMSAENVYRTLMQMKSMGYFRYTNGIIAGRVLFESSDTGMNYLEAFTKNFEEIPLIMEADIGHTSPKMLMINGAVIDLKMDEDKAEIRFELRK